MTGTDDIFAALSELEQAARELVAAGPCSDPDCCTTAKRNTEARGRLDAALAALDAQRGRT